MPKYRTNDTRLAVDKRSNMRGGGRIPSPRSFSAFARRVPDRNHTQRRVFGVITLHERKRAFREQAFARLILVWIAQTAASNSTERRSACEQSQSLTSCEKSSSTTPSRSSRHSFPSFEWISIPKSKNRSPARPNSCFVDFS
jgi:hypothetical protein